MAQRKPLLRTPGQVAEMAKPGWQALREPEAADEYESTEQADIVTPEISVLMRKYFGDDNTNENAADGEAAIPGESSFVTMEPKRVGDVRYGRKTVLVENGIVVGEQG